MLKYNTLPTLRGEKKPSYLGNAGSSMTSAATRDATAPLVTLLRNALPGSGAFSASSRLRREAWPG
jgi:hypothetical protein